VTGGLTPYLWVGGELPPGLVLKSRRHAQRNPDCCRDLQRCGVSRWWLGARRKSSMRLSHWWSIEL